MKVWITYALEDKDLVQAIKSKLTEAEIETLDIENVILPGDNIVESIYSAISKADIIIIILSKASNEKKWFSTEIGLIISEVRKNRSKKLIPILKDRQAEIPPFINQYQYLDFTDGGDINRLLDILLLSLKSRKEHHLDENLIIEQNNQINISRREWLEKEKYEYEKEKRSKQKQITYTFLFTFLGALVSIFAILISTNKIFNETEYPLSRTLLTVLTGVAVGVIVSLILNQLKRK